LYILNIKRKALIEDVSLFYAYWLNRAVQFDFNRCR